MDYIYSKLSESVEKVEYSGSTTTTAVVTVDNNNNVISVDVRELSPDILNVAKPAVNGNYALIQKVSANGVTTYSWVSADQVSQPLLDEIERAKSAEAAIAGGVNQEISDRIAADNAINNSISDLTVRVSSVESTATTNSKRIDGIDEQTAKLEARLETESSERQKQDEELSNGIDGTQSRITNLDKEIQEKHNILNTKVNNEITDRKNADEELLDKINSVDTNFTEALSNESTRVDNMINQLNDNVSSSINQLNQNLVDAINTINGGIATEIEERKAENLDIRKNIDNNLQFTTQALQAAEAAINKEIEDREKAVSDEATVRQTVDQHLWDILPDNIIAGTPMQGMENKNAVNIVFSKYQKHGIGEDPAEAELVEVPNQAITLFPATQEVAGVLTSADKTKIDNIATDIETAVQTEADARQTADTELENKLDSLIVVEGDAIQVGREDKELNIKTGGRFTVNSNYEVVTSEEYPGEPGRRIIPLENNDQIAGKKTDGNGVPLIFVSKWDKVEVGGKGAHLNLNSNDGKVTVDDEHTLLDETDKQDLTGAIEAEENRATQSEDALDEKINTTKNDILGDVAESYNTLGKLEDAIQDEATAREEADTQLQTSIDAIDTRVGNLEGKTTRLFYNGDVTPPTSNDINDWVISQPVEPPYAPPFVGIAVVVLQSDGTYHIWHYYSNLEGGKWQDDGVDTVSTFTNSIRGIIQGSTNDGYVAAENGLGKISGWNTVKTDITNLQNNLSSNVSNINNSISIINQNVANIANDLAANVVTLGNAYTQANNAYTQANTAYTRADEAYDLASDANTLATNANTVATTANNDITTHAANTNNPHYVTKEQIGLANVADVLQYSANNEPPYPVTSVAGRTGAIDLTKADVGLANVLNVDATNASNINSGTLARNRIEDGLIVAGANISVTRSDENGAYTISATSGGVVPVVSVAGKNGPDVALSSITFTGACTATYNGASEVTVTIPTVPTLHSVSISTNNGSATTVVGNVYSNSATPIEIPIPESQTITLANTYNVNSGANGIVTGISLENGVLTVSYGALDDGTL